MHTAHKSWLLACPGSLGSWGRPSLLKNTIETIVEFVMVRMEIVLVLMEKAMVSVGLYWSFVALWHVMSSGYHEEPVMVLMVG